MFAKVNVTRGPVVFLECAGLTALLFSSSDGDRINGSVAFT